MGVHGSSRLFYSTSPFHSDTDNADDIDSVEIDDNDFVPERREIKLHGVDPRKGWNSRGVHKVCVSNWRGKNEIWFLIVLEFALHDFVCSI